MNSFKAIGEARLLATEGQRQLTAALGRLIVRAVDAICRHLPETKSTPW